MSEAEVWPNEREQKEYECDRSKIDIFIRIKSEENDDNLIIFLEQKVDSPIDKDQCSKYLSWFEKKFTGYFILPVFLAQNEKYSISSEETFGDSRWYGIDYQLLHDIVLSPIVNHPSLNPQTKTLIEHYIDVLRIPDKGRKLAVTEEERELALQLYDKHREAFEAIQAALSDTTDISLVPVTSKNKGSELIVNNHKIFGNTVPEFYQSALKYMVKNISNLDEQMPYATSNKRYLIAKQKLHPNGKEFRMPIEYKGYYMEAHKSHEQAIKSLAKFLKLLKVNVKLG